MTDVPRVQGFASSAIPNDEREQYEALFDRVTGLPRWALLLDRTRVALARAQRVNRRVAVYVLDDVQTLSGSIPNIERFVAALRGKVRSDDTIARVADQTFVVMCNDLGRDQDAELVAQRLVQNNDVMCRLGIALSSGGDDAPTLLTTAIKEAMRNTPAA
jgi:GGDEF domain-containing protein